MTSAAPQSLHDLGFSELADVPAADGVNPNHAKNLWRVLHREGGLRDGPRFLHHKPEPGDTKLLPDGGALAIQALCSLDIQERMAIIGS